MKVQNTMEMLKDLGELNSTIPMQDLFIGTQNFPVAIHPELKRQLLEMTSREYSMALVILANINRDKFKSIMATYIGKENAETYEKLSDIFKPNYAYTDDLKLILEKNILLGIQEILFIFSITVLLITPFEDIEKACDNRIKNHLERSMQLNPDDMKQVVPVGILENISEEDKKNIIGSIWNCIIDIIDHQTSNKEVRGGE